MDSSHYLLSLTALVFVICMMLGLSWLLRRMGLAGATPLGTQRHLGVVEVHPIDHRRKLLLVRRDETAHLILLGPNSETVIETGIPLADAKTTAQAAIHAVEGSGKTGGHTA